MGPLRVSAWIFGDAPLDQAPGRIAAAGYEGVDLPGEPDSRPAAELRRRLARHGLRPLALTASCAFPATRRDLAHPDAAIRADAVRYLVRCLELAGLGATSRARVG